MDRTSRSPGLALQSLGEDLNLRLRQIAKRIRWPAGTPDVFIPGPVATTLGNYVGLLPVPTVYTDTLATMFLDPGRWTVFASLYWEVTSPIAGDGRSSARIRAGSTTLASTTAFSLVDSPTPNNVSHTVVGTYTSEDPTLVSLDFLAQTPSALGTSSAVSIRLCAVGG